MLFRGDWRRPAGFHAADTEWFVLSGRVRAGERTLGPHGYLRAPAAMRVPELEVEKGSEVLVFREYGDAGCSRVDERIAQIEKRLHAFECLFGRTEALRNDATRSRQILERIPAAPARRPSGRRGGP